MFFPKVTMNILTPKLWLGLWNENMSNYELTIIICILLWGVKLLTFVDSGCQQDYYSDPMLSDPLHGAVDNPPGHLLVLQENLPTEAGLQEETNGRGTEACFPCLPAN